MRTASALLWKERIEEESCRSVAVEGNDGLEVVVTGLALAPAAVRACATLLSDAERERAGRFAFARDARRYIVARARLRELLAARSGVRPESVALVTGAHGKPALADAGEGRDLRFNLAHSDEVAVYAFASGREVGIDVEAVRTLRDTDTLAAHWFSRRELEAYQALDPRQKLLGFFNCWTRKEAYVKALGAGLSHPLRTFDVSLAPGAPAELLRVETRPGDDRRWHMESFSPAPGFVAAVVAEVCR